MARKCRPWYRAERNAWYVMLHGRQRFLGEHPEDAPKPRKRGKDWNVPKVIEDAFHRLMVTPQQQPVQTEGIPLNGIFAKFLKWTARYREPGTFTWYQQRLDEFDRLQPTLTVEELKPHHVTDWIDTKNSDTHRRGCVIAVSRALNWAVKQGHIDKNPIRGMEKPSASRREAVLSDGEYQTILDHASDQQFRDLLAFCWETGARPQEAFALEQRHLDLPHDRSVFPEQESKGKKKKRVIYFNEAALELVKRLAEVHPEGPLFRNADGEPWNRNHIACRFDRIMISIGRKHMKPITEEDIQKHLPEIPPTKPVRDKKTGETKQVRRTKQEAIRLARSRLVRRAAKQHAAKYCLYNFRHTWMTRMLKAGVDPITVATLAGHNDVSMLAKIYAHIQNDTEHLQKALGKLGTSSPPKPSAAK